MNGKLTKIELASLPKDAQDCLKRISSDEYIGDRGFYVFYLDPMETYIDYGTFSSEESFDDYPWADYLYDIKNSALYLGHQVERSCDDDSKTNV